MAFLLLIGPTSVTAGAASEELLTAFQAMYRPELDTVTTLDVDTLVLEHKDISVTFIGGRLAFFEPIVIDSTDIIFGAYYEGAGQLRYRPPTDIEREQLVRFFNSDSLDRSFDKMLMLFSPEIHSTIIEACVPAADLFSKSERNRARGVFEELTGKDHRGFIFETLDNLVHPGQGSFMLLNVEPDRSERVFYIYNPNKREEVRLLKKFAQPGVSFMETVCRYTQYVDPGCININGMRKDRIRTDRYIIDARISRGMDFEAAAALDFEVLIGSTRALRMDIHPELEVDSIVDSTGQQVAFVRYGPGEKESWPIYMFLDRPLDHREFITLKFFYRGDIIRKESGQCVVKAGADWYPRYGYRQEALFTLNFRTPKEYTFVATGKLSSQENVKDTTLSTWKVVPPTANVSFNIGTLKKYTFEEDDLVPIDVYFSKDLHEELGRLLAVEMVPSGKDMQNQVAQDIMNAMRVFDEFFGPYPYDRMAVGEILMSHGEAFPGFLHLGYHTWINTDAWGNDRVFRAHETAHQWWGVGVGYETYHDQWLSEGFAEYGALMYLQAVAGNDKFLERIKDYRNDVFSARQHLFGSGAEAGPIALGYRTSSTETPGDYDLIIYKKAALVVHMLRNLLIDLKTMKEDTFVSMMKEFYGANRGSSVCTQDLRQLTEKYTNIDMGWFFDQWVFRSDLPTYEFSYDVEKDDGGTFTARCTVITTGVSEDFQMYVPLEIEIDEGSRAYIRIYINRPNYEFSLPGLPQKPRKLRLNPFESVLARVKQ
jgi:hypothetical protein